MIWSQKNVEEWKYEKYRFLFLFDEPRLKMNSQYNGVFLILRSEE